MSECEGKDASTESVPLVTAVLDLKVPFHSLLLFVSQLAIPLSASCYVRLIASLLVLITHPSAHCLGCRELTEAVSPFEENIAQRHINAEPKLNVCHYNDFKKLESLCSIPSAAEKVLI